MKRRAFLGAAGGSLALLGTGIAIDNTLLGYGPLTGTNLTQQSIKDISDQPFPQEGTQINTPTEITIQHTQSGFFFTNSDGNTTRYPFNSELSHQGIPEDLLEELQTAHTDFQKFYDDDFTFEKYTPNEFFDTLSDSTTHSLTVSGLRGRNYIDVEPSLVKEFTGISPTDTNELVSALATAFRQSAYYDGPRYIAGAIQDNVLFGATDLREYFRSDVRLKNLVETDEEVGMFCYEYTWRSLEAFHAVPAVNQTVPVFACTVIDDRHKHVYTLLGSVYEENGELRVPVTFLDYTHAVLYDDVNARGILGNGVNGYNDRHRATNIWWDYNP